MSSDDKRPIFIETQCETAEEFLEALSPWNTALWHDHPEDWLFRGQAKDGPAWKLYPSSLRPDSPLLEHEARGIRKALNWEQVRIEITLLLMFIARCNHSGLPLPTPDSLRHLMTARRTLFEAMVASWDEFDMPDPLEAKKFSKSKEEWDRLLENYPPEDLHDAMALAQHYGVRTRMLDWTHTPLTAAYFAAVEPAREIHENLALRRKEARFKADREGTAPLHIDWDHWKSNTLAIWCVRRSFIEQECRPKPLMKGPENAGRPRVQVVDPLRAPNPYLMAQDGVFTVHMAKMAPKAELERVPLEDVLIELARREQGCIALLPEVFPPVRKITLPWKEAPKLLHRLQGVRVDAGRLLPGYSGVVQGMDEANMVSEIRRFCLKEDKFGLPFMW